MRGNLLVSDETQNNQFRAADPNQNVWVKANAGSGKTYVLSRRVLRLLINNVPPEEILCLTYTKAAAAEMRARVAGELAQWAILPDDKLVKELTTLEGRKPTSEKLLRARQLFAYALETPGGLKINTIHAFSESVLHRFPLEAGVPFDFEVIEDAAKRELLIAARENVLANQSAEPALHQAVETLFAIESDFALEQTIDTALGFGAKIPMVLDNFDRVRSLLMKRLELTEDQTVAALADQICNSPHLPPSEYEAVSKWMTHVGAAKNFNKKLVKTIGAPISAELVLSTFLGAEGKIPGRGHEPYNGVEKHDPVLAEKLESEITRLHALYQTYKCAQTVECTMALLTVLRAIYAQYQSHKRARAALDFDDLIIHLRQLLERSAFKDWVAYKLDAGITHILVDESQDTNPEQWRIVEALLSDFFDGESAVERSRSVFAVGDEKQSIFSFQGAEPRLFPETGRKLGMQALSAEKPWANITLKTSFRTVSTILQAVDLVFARPEAHEGLTGEDEATVHEAAREMDGGRVELWPPVPKTEIEKNDEVYPTSAKEPVAKPEDILANKIASKIATWLADGRKIGDRDAPVTPGDIMILVQSRGAAFKAMIRALKQKNIPNLGEDKLTVATHIAVEDLLILADVAMNPADDLALASLLRSPLFNWSEDQLFALAQGTRDGKPRIHDQMPRWPLWVQLKEAAKTDAAAEKARAQIENWRNRLDIERPYEFFANILFAERGLQKFHARLGREVDDVINEFLAMALSHEQSEQPAMLGFVAQMRQNQSQIKRELSEAAGAVRVMTVHGAKGLEAPIVFLIDATSAPTGRQNSKSILVVADHEKPQDAHLLWAPGSSKDQAQTVNALKDAEKAQDDAEYRRKLYVALTRAEDELYITGVEKKGQEKSWYQLVRDGLGDQCAPSANALGGEEALVFPSNIAPARMGDTANAEQPLAQLPNWISSPAPKPNARRILEPSSHDEEFTPQKAATGIDPELARLKGTSLHALLQFLPQFPPEQRHELAAQALLNLMPEHADMHDEMRDKALSIIDAPEFAHLFGPQSRAEIAVVADVEYGGKPTRITGRIDRLVVRDDLVQIVDFKSDSVPPLKAEDTPRQYQEQLKRYRAALRKQFPKMPINCAILWTENLTMSNFVDSEF
jgi:ATP-dependent helicase/nuclease subunit A